jgi:hypothetical protein|uniref:Uncharacterized protein n=1 Tax=Myoviridae sp. ctXXl13 TaxID=2827691 RepID=A0A8S5TJR7_9CAUD|nr:MAG TPA: hypothetical protein [Myoviridae sp. ctXXl13]
MSFDSDLNPMSIKDDIDDISDISRTDNSPEDNIERGSDIRDVIDTILDMELITDDIVNKEIDTYKNTPEKYESVYPFCEEKPIKKSASMINFIIESKYPEKDIEINDDELFDFTKEDLSSEDNGVDKYMDIYNKRMDKLYREDLDSRTNAIKLSILNSYHNVDDKEKM